MHDCLLWWGCGRCGPQLLIFRPQAMSSRHDTAQRLFQQIHQLCLFGDALQVSPQCFEPGLTQHKVQKPSHKSYHMAGHSSAAPGYRSSLELLDWQLPQVRVMSMIPILPATTAQKERTRGDSAALDHCTQIAKSRRNMPGFFFWGGEGANTSPTMQAFNCMSLQSKKASLASGVAPISGEDTCPCRTASHAKRGPPA